MSTWMSQSIILFHFKAFAVAGPFLWQYTVYYRDNYWQVCLQDGHFLGGKYMHTWILLCLSSQRKRFHAFNQTKRAESGSPIHHSCCIRWRKSRKGSECTTRLTREAKSVCCHLKPKHCSLHISGSKHNQWNDNLALKRKVNWSRKVTRLLLHKWLAVSIPALIVCVNQHLTLVSKDQKTEQRSVDRRLTILNSVS